MKRNEEIEIVTVASLNLYGFGQADNVHLARGGLSPLILAHLQGQIGHQINIVRYEEEGGEYD